MNLCVIPARGGSKRIPGKNIKPFLGKPIIAYSIEAALLSECFDRVIVSTDDPRIAEVAQRYGAEIPFFRPEELSNDFTATIPVIKHAIEWFNRYEKKPENVCCLYATAPFVTSQAISDAFTLFQNEDAGYCLTATSFAYPIQRAIKIKSNKRIKMLQPEFFNARSQELEEAFHDAGQLYWGKSEAFLKQVPLFAEETVAYILPRHLVQDIDTEEDWIRAELMYQVLQEMDKMR